MPMSYLLSIPVGGISFCCCLTYFSNSYSAVIISSSFVEEMQFLAIVEQQYEHFWSCLEGNFKFTQSILRNKNLVFNIFFKTSIFSENSLERYSQVAINFAKPLSDLLPSFSFSEKECVTSEIFNERILLVTCLFR